MIKDGEVLYPIVAPMSTDFQLAFSPRDEVYIGVDSVRVAIHDSGRGLFDAFFQQYLAVNGLLKKAGKRR